MQQPSSLLDWVNLQGPAIAGLDEAGRGPLAGPVVAAAVVLDPNHPLNSQLADSKKLSEAKRDRLFDAIHASALAVGFAVVGPERIDEINILRASLEAMKLAFDHAGRQSGLTLIGALVDGNQRAPLDASVRQVPVVGGDAIWPAIMAASIIAKVHRDRLMLQAALDYPGYGFEKHKGYPTALHLAALEALGPCAIHRKSFGPVAKCLKNPLPSI